MRKAVLAAILDGVLLPASVFNQPHTFKRLHGSDLSRMRGDASRVGNYFSTVIEREHGNKSERLAAEAGKNHQRTR